VVFASIFGPFQTKFEKKNSYQPRHVWGLKAWTEIRHISLTRFSSSSSSGGGGSSSSSSSSGGGGGSSSSSK
jgi:uncharacterized membrane protein